MAEDHRSQETVVYAVVERVIEVDVQLPEMTSQDRVVQLGPFFLQGEDLGHIERQGVERH